MEYKMRRFGPSTILERFPISAGKRHAEQRLQNTSPPRNSICMDKSLVREKPHARLMMTIAMIPIAMTMFATH